MKNRPVTWLAACGERGERGKTMKQIECELHKNSHFVLVARLCHGIGFGRPSPVRSNGACCIRSCEGQLSGILWPLCRAFDCAANGNQSTNSIVKSGPFGTFGHRLHWRQCRWHLTDCVWLLAKNQLRKITLCDAAISRTIDKHVNAMRTSDRAQIDPSILCARDRHNAK